MRIGILLVVVVVRVAENELYISENKIDNSRNMP
jgi:hypothetical protein